MRIVTFKIPEPILELIDLLVRTGRFSSRSEVIRAALREFLKKELGAPTVEMIKVNRKGRYVTKIVDLEE